MNESDNTIKINNLEFDKNTGMLIGTESFDLNENPAFSGVRFGKVYVNNKVTAIDAKKFQVLPSSIRERILTYPNSDYTRDILSQPIGTVTEDTFPNFKDISYTPNGEAIIMNDENGNPTRTPFFLN